MSIIANIPAVALAHGGFLPAPNWAIRDLQQKGRNYFKPNVQYFRYNARFSISHKCSKSKVLPKPTLGVKIKSLFIKITPTFINNYLVLLNIIENTILLSVNTSMTTFSHLLQPGRIIERKTSVSQHNHEAYVK